MTWLRIRSVHTWAERSWIRGPEDGFPFQGNVRFRPRGTTMAPGVAENSPSLQLYFNTGNVLKGQRE